jgi:hypothetical protein
MGEDGAADAGCLPATAEGGIARLEFGLSKRERGRLLRQPPSGGFPEGLLDRAFTPGLKWS